MKTLDNIFDYSGADGAPELQQPIHFVGAEGVGKTTLARRTDALLRARFKVKPMITEVARAVQSRFELDISAMRADTATVNRYQREVFRRQYAEEKSRSFSGYVSDRSLVDNLCYQAEYGTGLADLLAEEKAILDDYLPRLRRDAIIFHVTPQRSIYESSRQVDGVRAVVGFEAVQRIDAMLKMLLKIWDLHVFYVQTPLAGEREEQVQAVLSAVLRVTF